MKNDVSTMEVALAVIEAKFRCASISIHTTRHEKLLRSLNY